MFKTLTAGVLTLWSLIGGCPYSNQNCNECIDYNYRIKKIGRLPAEIKESSGLVRLDDLYFTHGDSGNEPILYGFNYPFNTDTIERLIQIPAATNTDWEDLTSDETSRIFVGDFGNNGNNRDNLKIISYQFQNDQSENILFRYKDQHAFPPEKPKHQNFDCEAMFWHKETLYLFSKNKRSAHTKIYNLDVKLPEQIIISYDSIKLGKTFVTSADINPNKSEVALLAYGKVLFLEVGQTDDGLLNFTPRSCKRFGRSGQAEAIIYLDNEHLMITNEKGKVFLLYRKYKGSSGSRDTRIGEEELLKIFMNEGDN